MRFKLLFLFLCIPSVLDIDARAVLNINARWDGKKVDIYLRNNNFNGAALIVHHGEIILKKGYGYANYEYGITNTPQTKFPIASNTKSFTALAIMQLQERKALCIHDTLNKYIPDFVHGDKITIHHLLTHTSGIKNYYKQWSDICHCNTLAEMVDRLKVWELEFEPGTSYSYSNSGYAILAYLIEKVSGMKYETFLHENIFMPLGMNDSGSDDGKCIIKNRAYRYISDNKMVINAPAIDNPITLLGSGDLYSSLDDMHKWDQALRTERIVTKKSFEEMIVPHMPMQNSSTRAHGYGWFIDTIRNRKVVEYSGALVGATSKVMRFIDDEVTIIIMTNVEDFDTFQKICDDIPAMIFDI